MRNTDLNVVISYLIYTTIACMVALTGSYIYRRHKK